MPPPPPLPTLGFYAAGQPLTFLTRGGEIRAAPRWLTPDMLNPIVTRNRAVERYESFWEFCVARRPQHIVIHRTYALGDIIMLLPVLRALRRLLQEQLEMAAAITLATHQRFMAMAQTNGLMPGLRIVQARGLCVDYGGDVHFDLNSALEIDHRGGLESNYHRVELYGRALGIEVTTGGVE